MGQLSSMPILEREELAILTAAARKHTRKSLPTR